MRMRIKVICCAAIFLGSSAPSNAEDQHQQGADQQSAKAPAPAPATAPEIPGITAKDNFAQGCVSCHANHPERNYDGRLSTLFKTWTEKGVEKEVVNIANAVKTAEKTLKGKHPDISAKVKAPDAKIPDLCKPCHAEKMALPLNRLLHLIHLSPKPEFTGDQNHFLTHYAGQCTNCHALNPDNGAMSVKSGSEQKL